MIEKLKRNQFLFEELVSKDFKQKYKRTVLGMLWSILYPLLNLFVMSIIYIRIFGRTTPHFIIYLFCGNLVMSYFRESTKNGMSCLMSNRGVITKINVPKYLFLLSSNVSSLINFGLTLLIFFVFCILDKITFSWIFITLVYPIGCLCVFNIGAGLVLSALFVFFRDTSYLYDLFLLLLNYLSAIFYRIDIFPENAQKLFLFNPIYCYISYFRTVVIDNAFPSLELHALCLCYSLLMFFIGAWFYKKFNHKFLYYM